MEVYTFSIDNSTDVSLLVVREALSGAEKGQNHDDKSTTVHDGALDVI